ncbi:MAG: desulfoferrodoxin [Dehalococcoidia bacterium]|nr:desulfoferrodoxin [Dehalococcoidia bacterium]
MTGLKQVYRCRICGNVVEVLHTGKGSLVCCGQPMELFHEKAMDVGKEKHVPIVEATDKGIKVKVGDIPHPMESGHYIEWIEITIDNRSFLSFLQPGEKPETEFNTKSQNVTARAYCNVHGLWKSS